MSNLAVIDHPTETIESGEELLSLPNPTVYVKVSKRPAGKFACINVAEIHSVDLAKGVVSELVIASINIEPAHPKACFSEDTLAFIEKCKKLSAKRAPEVDYAFDGATRNKHGKPCDNYKFSVSIYVENDRDIIANAMVELVRSVGDYLLTNVIVKW